MADRPTDCDSRTTATDTHTRHTHDGGVRVQNLWDDMEDLYETSNEVQDILSRSYGVPEEFDEADLEEGTPPPPLLLPLQHLSLCQKRRRPLLWRRVG